MKKKNKNVESNNKNLIIVIIVLLVLLLIGLLIMNRKETPEVYEHILEMTIREGSSSVYHKYTIKKDGTLKYKYFNCGKTLEGTTKLSKIDYSKLMDICKGNKVFSWHGKHSLFEKMSSLRAGGNVRTVEITLENTNKKFKKTCYSSKDKKDFYKKSQEFLDEKIGYNE